MPAWAALKLATILIDVMRVVPWGFGIFNLGMFSLGPAAGPAVPLITSDRPLHLCSHLVCCV